jgi:hypothetical protein
MVVNLLACHDILNLQLVPIIIIIPSRGQDPGIESGVVVHAVLVG